MEKVVYSKDEDDIRSFVIDGEEYVEDEERAIIPKCTIVKRVDTFFKEKYLRTVA